MHPVGIIALFEIGFQSTVNGLFRVNGFLNALAANLGKPAFHWLRAGRRNGLDDTQELFRSSNIGYAALSVRCGHFQLLTICQQFICALFFQPLLEFGPVVARSTSGLLTCQNRNDIGN